MEIAIVIGIAVALFAGVILGPRAKAGKGKKRP
jgi:hypothetical protein